MGVGVFEGRGQECECVVVKRKKRDVAHLKLCLKENFVCIVNKEIKKGRVMNTKKELILFLTRTRRKTGNKQGKQ